MKTYKQVVCIASIALTGCATQTPGIVQIGPYKVAPGQMAPQPVVEMVDDPGAFVYGRANDVTQSVVSQPINDVFILADQANQLIGGIMGPNNVSGAILKGQNYYRTGLGVINNPWTGFFALRNLWVN